MRRLDSGIFFIVLIVLSLTISSCNVRIFHKDSSRQGEKELFGPSRKYNDSGAAARARKKQESREKKIKKNYENSIKNSRKRTIDIQTPEVQDRMQQNNKNIIVRDKAKRKKFVSATKKAGKKYK